MANKVKKTSEQLHDAALAVAEFEHVIEWHERNKKHANSLLEAAAKTLVTLGVKEFEYDETNHMASLVLHRIKEYLYS